MHSFSFSLSPFLLRFETPLSFHERFSRGSPLFARSGQWPARLKSNVCHVHRPRRLVIGARERQLHLKKSMLRWKVSYGLRNRLFRVTPDCVASSNISIRAILFLLLWAIYDSFKLGILTFKFWSSTMHYDFFERSIFFNGDRGLDTRVIDRKINCGIVPFIVLIKPIVFAPLLPWHVLNFSSNPWETIYPR